MMADFFDRLLRPEISAQVEFGIRYYTMGEGQWHDTKVWPPQGFESASRLYFEANHVLSSTPPTSVSASDVYPVNFTASTGNSNRWATELNLDILYPDRSSEDKKLKLDRVYIVGHDFGGMVAYAFVRSYPEATRGAMILDVPLPGIEGWDEIQGHPAMWHVRFMQVPGLAEKLVADRQADYFGYFFQFGKFTSSEVDHYVNAYATPAQLHAVFEMYRAFPANAQFNAAQRGPNDVPLFLAAGDGSLFAKLVPKMAAGLRANGCTHVVYVSQTSAAANFHCR